MAYIDGEVMRIDDELMRIDGLHKCTLWDCGIVSCTIYALLYGVALIAIFVLVGSLT